MISKKDFVVGNYVQFTYHGKTRRGEIHAVKERSICLSDAVLGESMYKSYRYDKIENLKVLDKV